MQAQSVLSSLDRWKHKALSNSKAEVTRLEVTSVGIVLDLSPWTMQDSSEVQDCNRPQCENEAEVIPSDYCAWRVLTCTRNTLHGSLGVCIASLKTSAAYINRTLCGTLIRKFTSVLWAPTHWQESEYRAESVASKQQTSHGPLAFTAWCFPTTCYYAWCHGRSLMSKCLNVRVICGMFELYDLGEVQVPKDMTHFVLFQYA